MTDLRGRRAAGVSAAVTCLALSAVLAVYAWVASTSDVFLVLAEAFRAAVHLGQLFGHLWTPAAVAALIVMRLGRQSPARSADQRRPPTPGRD
ncbi:hypothetical protein [Cryptosporangium sp. NPDC051539]|uniref:hypothetical protein n=1 Tax=Cryptosporangium sp. NPDC051539 TaxID=3363962 RepID=UPI0037AFB17E